MFSAGLLPDSLKMGRTKGPGTEGSLSPRFVRCTSGGTVSTSGPPAVSVQAAQEKKATTTKIKKQNKIKKQKQNKQPQK